MSQAKVDLKKEQKHNRKKLVQKKKREKLIGGIVGPGGDGGFHAGIILRSPHWFSTRALSSASSMADSSTSVVY